MLAVLERRVYLPFCTMGTLTYNGRTLVTMEKPWLGNLPYESCIPEGVYTCKRYRSDRFPNTFEITDVEGRTHILFHVGNTVKDVVGCVALGQYIDQDKYEIRNSRFAFREFIADMEGRDEFELKIRHYSPTHK